MPTGLGVCLCMYGDWKINIFFFYLLKFATVDVIICKHRKLWDFRPQKLLNWEFGGGGGPISFAVDCTFLYGTPLPAVGGIATSGRKSSYLIGGLGT